MLFLTPESLPICRRLEIMFFHEVDYKFGRSIIRPLNSFYLFENLACLAPLTVNEVAETLLEDVEEHLMYVLPHVDQVIISLEEKRNVYLSKHGQILKFVSLYSGFDSGCPLLLHRHLLFDSLYTEVV